MSKRTPNFLVPNELHGRLARDTSHRARVDSPLDVDAEMVECQERHEQFYRVCVCEWMNEEPPVLRKRHQYLKITGKEGGAPGGTCSYEAQTGDGHMA